MNNIELTNLCNEIAQNWMVDTRMDVALNLLRSALLDSWKQGMSDAAVILTVGMRKFEPLQISQAELAVTGAILTARDNKTSI